MSKRTYNHYNRELNNFAKQLRNNATQEERILWNQYLNTYPIPFRRQRIIDNYIVDFYCSKAKLVIELDGSQHYSEGGLQKDAIRTEVLEEYGLSVLRFTNTEVKKNLQGICEMIDLTVKRALEEQK